MKLKNVDNTLENLDKIVLKSLSILDNNNVYISLIFILFLYNTCIFSNINNYVSNLYQYPMVKVIALLVIIYVSRKSCLIGLLLTISFLISINYKSIMENFESTIFPLPNSNQDKYAEISNANKQEEENKKAESFSSSEEQVINDSYNPTNFTSEEKESFNNHKNNFLDRNICYKNYPKKFESINDDCSPVSTFNDALNAQGLNATTGYTKQVGYVL